MGFLLQLVFERLDKGEQLHRTIVTDIVDTVGRAAGARVRFSAAPGRIRLGDFVHYPDQAFYNIVDIREVAFHFAEIEDLDGTIGEDGPSEDKQGHVRPSPRSIDGEKAQPGARQRVQ